MIKNVRPLRLYHASKAVMDKFWYNVRYINIVLWQCSMLVYFFHVQGWNKNINSTVKRTYLDIILDIMTRYYPIFPKEVLLTEFCGVVTLF